MTLKDECFLQNINFSGEEIWRCDREDVKAAVLEFIKKAEETQTLLSAYDNNYDELMNIFEEVFGDWAEE
jgi:hypothetical protein